jgi:hypothetical protein
VWGKAVSPASFANTVREDGQLNYVYIASQNAEEVNVAAHEITHAATFVAGAYNKGDDPDVAFVKNEGVAEATAVLSMTSYMTPAEVAQYAREEATAFAASTGDDLIHAHMVDSLLKVAHKLETEPAKVLQEAGTTTTSREAWVRENVSDTGDNKTMIADAEQYGMGSVYLQMLHGDESFIPKLDRDGIIPIINAEMALRQQIGENNLLSSKMREVRDANPEAYKEAQDYLKQNYGVTHAPVQPKM